MSGLADAPLMPHRGLRLEGVLLVMAVLCVLGLGWYLGKGGNIALAGVGLLALVGGIVVLSAPLLGLAGIVFVVATNASENLILYLGAPSIAKFLLPAALLLLAYRWLAQGERALVEPKAVWLFAGLAGLILAGAPIARDWGATIAAFSDFLKDAGIALLVVAFFSRPRALASVFTALLGVALFVCTLAVFKYTVGDMTSDYYGFARSMYATARLAGPLTDPNFFGALLVVLLPVGFYTMIFAASWPERLLGAWGIGVILACIFLTQSRGTLLAVFAMAGLTLLLFDRRIALRLTVLFGVVGFIAAAALSEQLVERFGSILDLANVSETQDDSIQGRVAQWIVAINQFIDHPILGVGAENYKTHFEDYSLDLGLKFRDGQLRSAHSLYFEALAELGFVGFSWFAAILGSAALGILRAMALARKSGLPRLRARYACLGIGLAGYFAAMIFLHDAYPRMMWMLLAIAIALPRIAEVEVAASGPAKNGVKDEAEDEAHNEPGAPEWAR